MTIASGLRHFLERLDETKHDTSKQAIKMFHTNKVILDVKKEDDFPIGNL